MSDKMTTSQAEHELKRRIKRVSSNKRGPRSRGFTIPEIDAVRCLASHAHSQATIANRAGMSLSAFKRAMESDSKLRDAFDAGIAEERLKIDGALLKTALDSKNPRQVQAAMSLLKSRHGLTEGGGASVSVNVNNVLALPAPLDPRKYQNVIKRVAKQSPTVIEHEAPDKGPRVPVDPIQAEKERQRINRA